MIQTLREAVYGFLILFVGFHAILIRSSIIRKTTVVEYKTRVMIYLQKVKRWH
jgi:hypothetical protein